MTTLPPHIVPDKYIPLRHQPLTPPIFRQFGESRILGLYRPVLAAEGLFKAHAFAHASLMTLSRPAATPRGPPLQFLCLVAALEHANEISGFSLKTRACIYRPPKTLQSHPWWRQPAQ